VAKVTKPATSHKDHNPEVMTVDMFSLTQWWGKVTQLALIAAGSYKYISLGASPVPWPLSWCRHIQLTWEPPAQGVTGQRQEAIDAVPWACLLVPPCWKGLSSALSSVDLSLSPSHPF